MRKRKMLIRGEYDTFAESFAKENGLDFLHSDIHIADDDRKENHIEKRANKSKEPLENKAGHSLCRNTAEHHNEFIWQCAENRVLQPDIG